MRIRPGVVGVANLMLKIPVAIVWVSRHCLWSHEERILE
jgi:hypothetical protein